MGKTVITPRYTCDFPGCGVEKPEDEMLSYRLYVALPGAARVGSFQCDEEHYACSPEHGRALLIRCFDEHVEPARQAKVMAAITPNAR